MKHELRPTHETEVKGTSLEKENLMRVSVPTFFGVLILTQWEEIPKRNQQVVSNFALAS